VTKLSKEDYMDPIEEKYMSNKERRITSAVCAVVYQYD
jgi:hypothetical protein